MFKLGLSFFIWLLDHVRAGDAGTGMVSLLRWLYCDSSHATAVKFSKAIIDEP